MRMSLSLKEGKGRLDDQSSIMSGLRLCQKEVKQEGRGIIGHGNPITGHQGLNRGQIACVAPLSSLFILSSRPLSFSSSPLSSSTG